MRDRFLAVMQCTFRTSVSMLIFLLLLAMPALGQDAPLTSEPEGSAARSLVHILDYIAQDYRVAVSGGEVIDATEYSEMVAFGRNASSLLSDLAAAGTLPSGNRLQGATRQLQASIEEKAAPEVVAGQARAIRDRVIAETDIQTAPLQWPNIADGQKLYQQLCTSCHGTSGTGDGPLAPDLDPKPTNFVEGMRVASLSPFQAYNTIRLGVEGTAMPASRQLTDEEVWDIAFFLKSLQSAQRQSKRGQSTASALDTLMGIVSLQQVATLNDRELAAALAVRSIGAPEQAVAALRTGTPEPHMNKMLRIARRHLDEALTSYRDGDVSRARQHALRAYLEGIEPVEPSLNARGATLTVVLEQRMMAVRSAIEANASPKAVAKAVELARASISDAARLLNQRDGSPWFSFFVAASILLREGLEAFLVILAILSVLRAAGQPEAARWVHGGWIFAVALGIAGWFFLDLLVRLGAAQREVMEGGIALLAVAVLLYVGFWLHSMTEIRKWKEFIDQRVKHTLSGGSLLGLASISFFAVFREAFESVLFLSALTLEQGTNHKMAVAGGAVAAITLVLALAAVLLRYSVRLPIRSLFKFSSSVMGVLCIILAGKGIHALQEAGLLSITAVPLAVRFDLFGLYPTIETLIAQIALLLTVLLLWHIPKRLAPECA